ncbi:hypothetical protein ACA910_005988 [Epithemia clementina (nom. ined.)]
MRRVPSREMREQHSRSFGSDDDDEAISRNKIEERESSNDASSSFSSFSWSWFSLPGVRGLSRQTSRSSARDDMVTTIETPQQHQQQLEMRPILEGSLVYTSQSSRDSVSSSADSFDGNRLPAGGDVENQAIKKVKLPLGRLRETLIAKSKPLNVDEYAAGREMTKLQEQWNALSMIPPTIYCLVYLLTRDWINSDLLDKAQDEYTSDPLNFTPQVPDTTVVSSNHNTSPWHRLMGGGQAFSPSSVGCLPWTFLPALPPLAILAVIVGTVLHMPCSFLYHWKYAHTIDRISRLNHWSRRLDQAMIHFASAIYSYASSGSVDYFIACALYNLHCMYRHAFLSHLRPRSNQMRVGISILAYCLPILRRGDLDRFALLFLVVGTSIWLFSKYPIGGWSHCAFHLVVGFVPVILMQVAQELPVSQPQLMFAAQCSVLSQHS